jgi:hypothetical protein
MTREPVILLGFALQVLGYRDFFDSTLFVQGKF